MFNKHPSKRRCIRGLLAEISALSLASSAAMAALVDSGPVNIVIPATSDGVYLNVVTGASGTTPATAPAGWDINPYGSTGFTLWGATANTWFNPDGVVTGNYNLPPGTVIQGAAAAFFRPGGANNLAAQFTLNSDQNFLGYRFANEANAGANHFGYIQVQFGATITTRSIIRIVYDNVADTAVTIPAGIPNTAPTLTYNPTTAAGVTFPAGPAGAANASIAITSAGASGTGQSAVTGCAITGPGAASFGAVTVTPAGGVFNTGTTAGSIDLSCTRGGAEATATLACTETATPTVAGSPFTRSWALTCPAALITDVAPVAAVAATTLTAGTGSVTPTITTPAQGTGSTLFSCSIPATAPSNFAITGNAVQTISLATPPVAIGLSCVPQPAATVATLTCTQTATPGPNPAAATATITCPTAVAVVTPTTASGTPITLPAYAQPGSTSSTTLSFTATGNTATLTCETTGAGFSVTPSPLNLAIGVPGTITVRYTGTAIGTFAGNLTCTSKSGGPFTYALSATVNAGAPAIPLPAMNSASTWVLLLSILGMGLLFGARIRN